MSEEKEEKKEHKKNANILFVEMNPSNNKAGIQLDQDKKISLVKINSTLYNEASEIVEADRINYPSIKNFVETAVRNQINLIKYNIENRDEIISPNGKIKTENNEIRREFTSCIACGNLFLNEKEKNKMGKRICSKCLKIIKNLSRFV